MRFRTLSLVVAGLLFFGWACESPVHAQTFGTYGSCGFAFPGWAGFAGGSPYSLGRIPTPPYFAIHPPVYYSVPVPRTYGYSPYAYPGTVRTPEVSFPESAMIQNPYVKPEVEVEESSYNDEKVADAPRPQIMINPFVEQQEETALTGSRVY